MQVQQTEYRTVEEEVTRFKCDSCGHVGTDEEMYELQIRGLDKRTGRLHQCDECSEMDQPVTLREVLLSEQVSVSADRIIDKVGFALAFSFFFMPGIMGIARFLMGGGFVSSFLWMLGMYVANIFLVLATMFVLEMLGFKFDP